jgi:multidrug resistance efflux pump
MKAREQSLKLKRFDVEEKARKVADLEYMIRDFEQMAADLERQVQVEEDRTGIRDHSHFAYSTFAKAAAQRRSNLMASAADLRSKLDVAIRDRDEAAADLERAAPEAPRDPERIARSAERGYSAGLR